MSKRVAVVIATEHASAAFGGEAALPLHYFRVLRSRGVPVWLVTHDRVREGLSELYPDDPSIVYIADRAWQRKAYRWGRKLPDQVAYITTGFVSRLATMASQRAVVKAIVAEHGATVVHQPTPVSPREPSILFGLGVPVVVGPMNGGMEYPPAFATARSPMEIRVLGLARAGAALFNLVLPGKRKAARLIVANERTRDALPGSLGSGALRIVENGVDLSLWRAEERPRESRSGAVEFVYMGRLINWKAVDLLLEAFAVVRQHAPRATLTVIGDGPERVSLEQLAGRLDLSVGAEGDVRFLGWLSQQRCAEILADGDCLVLPSLLECGGAVVLEAMALGKPVVATAWGGPLDYLDPSCGFLVEPNSADDLVAGFAAAMSSLAADEHLRASLGAQGAAKVRREFDWEIKVDAMMTVYQDVINEAAR